jgi:phosphatidylglycerol---prolipoprotein diacylglyceryl transferase
MLAALMTWDLDPILVDFGALQIRYYGLWFAATIYAGMWIWGREVNQRGHSPYFAEEFLLYGVLGIVLGSRLGHCLFYEPERYLANPIEILYFWKGGLASHGATVGLFFVVWLFGRRHKLTFRRTADMFVPAVAFAAGGVRIGNFFNSEIVGRAWDGPWAVIFARYDRMMGIEPAIARHPTALYEVAMGFITFAVLMGLKKLDLRRAGSGLYVGTFLIFYFSFRFLVEFFKEFQVDAFKNSAAEIARAGEGLQLTMGQYLSIVPVVIGVAFVIMALRQDKDAFPPEIAWSPELEVVPEAPVKTAGKGKGKRKKKK